MEQSRRQQRYPAGVRQSALERMKLGVNVSALALELGVDRTTLYYWKRQAEAPPAPCPAAVLEQRDYRIRELESRVAALETQLGQAALETRFFKAALRRIAASRPKNAAPGATASSPRSAADATRKAH
jgi:transposase-like protein